MCGVRLKQTSKIYDNLTLDRFLFRLSIIHSYLLIHSSSYFFVYLCKECFKFEITICLGILRLWKILLSNEVDDKINIIRIVY